MFLITFSLSLTPLVPNETIAESVALLIVGIFTVTWSLIGVDKINNLSMILIPWYAQWINLNESFTYSVLNES